MWFVPWKNFLHSTLDRDLLLMLYTGKPSLQVSLLKLRRWCRGILLIFWYLLCNLVGFRYNSVTHCWTRCLSMDLASSRDDKRRTLFLSCQMFFSNSPYCAMRRLSHWSCGEGSNERWWKTLYHKEEWNPVRNKSHPIIFCWWMIAEMRFNLASGDILVGTLYVVR